MKKTVFVTSILLSFAILFTGCSSSPKSPAPASSLTEKQSDPATKKPLADTIKIGYPDSGKSFPGGSISIAVEKGLADPEFKKIGVKLELIPFVAAGPAINEAMASKSIDAGIYGDTPNIISKSSGVDTVLVGVGTSYQGASFVVPSDSPISSVKDLKGKKVATTKGSYMHRTFIEGLKANGLTDKDVEFFSMTSPEMEAAIVSKKIDAVIISDTTAIKLVQANNGKIILNCAGHPEWGGLNIVTVRSDYAKANVETISTLLKVLQLGKKYADENPEEAKQIWTKGGTPKSVFDELYKDKKFYLEVEVTDQIVKTLTNNKIFMKETGLIKNDFDIQKWIDKSYYQASLKK